MKLKICLASGYVVDFHSLIRNFIRILDWEGFALEEVIRTFDANSEECFFWTTQADAELDLFIIKHGKRLGFEFKYADVPKITKSMRIALIDPKLDHLTVVYPGKETFPLDDKITAQRLESITQVS